MDSPLPRRMDRRTAIRWMLGAAACASWPGSAGFAQGGNPGGPPSSSASGYGLDPDLLHDYRPGDLWPLTFSEAQRRTAAALCAVIIPPDEKSPGAADLGVHDFIDEWISAPYPEQQADKDRVLEGLAWLEEEARKRFGGDFAGLSAERQESICDEICDEKAAGAEFAGAAAFFARFRHLTAGGYYTTPEGMANIGYTGNKPVVEFAGPPPEALKKAGLV